ncbi:hypothetical protein FFLO_01972 [Filobasidium floriforme]|uniref:Hook C-terminal domain-containing protein n=1 Tax=Filobasidium floriforme TaxID=5210 RepID=A0A8K0JNX2_9TREE|nr:hypothetical protein FFLO_01972 [Filobasidium floriforme]
MEDDSTDAAEQAFVAYFTTVIGRPVTFESLRNGRIIAEALNHEEPEHFPPPIDESELAEPAARQRYLKRIYHDLLTCPSCSLAAYLPPPNVSIIASSSSAGSTSSTQSSWQTELLSLCKVVLLVQAVWSKKNAGVIGVITELGVDDQRVLKEIIESALTSMALSEESEAKDEVDIQAEMLYNLQMERRERSSEREGLVKRVEDLRIQAEEQATAAASGSKPKITIGTPARARLGVNGSRKYTPARGSDDDDDTDPNPSSSPSDLPVTPLRKKPLGGKSSADTPASPMERMKNLEIERLKQESNERADEVARLEEVVAQGQKTIAQHVQRIAILEKETHEMDSLRDEIEVQKHASDNLKKSEATLEKMKKRLEEIPDLRDRIQTLEAQNNELTETNALLEDKYKELSSSSRGVRVGPVDSTGNDNELDESHSGPSGRSKSDLEDQQLRRDLRQREDEIEELRQRVEELEHDLGARVPVQGGTLGDVEGLKGDVSTDESESNVAATSLDEDGSLHADDGLTTQQLTQLLRVKEDNVLLKEQVKALDQKLMAAKDLLKEQEERHGGVTAGSVPAGGKRIQELEKTIDRLKQQQSEADERFHLERIIALKSWKDLGRRAARPTRDRTVATT